EVVVNRVINAGAVLAAVADVQRRHAEVLEKGRVVGARAERADAPVGPAADLVLVLCLRLVDRARLLPLPDAQMRFRILDVPRDVVDEALERMRAFGLEESASVAVGIYVRDRVLLQFPGMRLGPLG